MAAGAIAANGESCPALSQTDMADAEEECYGRCLWAKVLSISTAGKEAEKLRLRWDMR
jgi:hypothetical protein